MYRTTTPPLPTLRLTIRLWCFFFSTSRQFALTQLTVIWAKKKKKLAAKTGSRLFSLFLRAETWCGLCRGCRKVAGLTPRGVSHVFGFSDDCVNECTEGPRRIVRIIYYVQQTHHHPPPRGGSTRDLAKMPNPTGTWKDRINLYTMAKYIKSVCVAHYVPR